jgi:hypothetical protein
MCFYQAGYIGILATKTGGTICKLNVSGSFHFTLSLSSYFHIDNPELIITAPDNAFETIQVTTLSRGLRPWCIKTSHHDHEINSNAIL